MFKERKYMVYGLFMIMSLVVLLSCSSRKSKERTKAKYMYTGSLFRYSLLYAKSLKPDRIYILSAKHKLISFDSEIDPYNESLNGMTAARRKSWSEDVLGQLGKENNLERDTFIILAGKKYREFLIDGIRNYKVPLENMRIGQQLRHLKEVIDE